MFDFVQMCIFGRAGSCFPEVFSVACRDRFCNRIPFKPQTKIEMKLNSGGRAISSECNYDQYITECSYDRYITHDKYTMKFKKLGDDICRYGLCIKQCDANVVSLKIKQSNIELEMSNLGGINSADSVMLLCCCNGLALWTHAKGSVSLQINMVQPLQVSVTSVWMI
ncbi:uncharacterized protein LOC114073934 [Solanum pennellii]|uniref:Uncharacterized protein LOC114073934 n=1 Tax=Solanum pennellii TaxID=28526 RepID=A0ABM1V6P4_SOLPN|nr:uncharacterized protein LOC114073934 [Solanum pennellii]